MRTLWIGSFLAAVLVLAGCARDSTITRGADGEKDWNRRLTAAVPIGMPAVAARALMERNGFECRWIPEPRGLACDKRSERRLAGARRHWQATFAIREGQVIAVRSSTEIARK
jgi:hypothetical protein